MRERPLLALIIFAGFAACRSSSIEMRPGTPAPDVARTGEALDGSAETPRWGDRYWPRAVGNGHGGNGAAGEDGDSRPAGSIISPPPRAGIPDAWHRLTEWEGEGIKQTESFEVPASNWRIAWESSGTGELSVEVYSLPGDVLTARISQENDSGISYLLRPERGGTFYLRILARGVRWWVAVESSQAP